jgi:hypothetical protein
VDADSGYLYWGGDFAAGEGGLSEYKLSGDAAGCGTEGCFGPLGEQCSTADLHVFTEVRADKGVTVIRAIKADKSWPYLLDDGWLMSCVFGLSV